MARDIEQITPFTALEDSVVRNAGVEALPNSPSSAGIRASELKKRFYQPLEEVRDDIDDRFTKINSNFSEIDEDLTTVEGLAFDKANIEQEVSTSTTKVPSSNLLKTQLDLKVSKAGAENITGIKTYKSGATPLIEDAPSSNTMAANKAYVDTMIPLTAIKTAISGTPLDTNLLSEKFINTTYATKSDIVSVFEYKGTVADYTALSAITGQGVGDTYNMTASYLNTPAGTNWAWNGTSWDALGGDIIISTVMPISSAAASNEKVLGEKVVYDEVEKKAPLANPAFTGQIDHITNMSAKRKLPIGIYQVLPAASLNYWKIFRITSIGVFGVVLRITNFPYNSNPLCFADISINTYVGGFVNVTGYKYQNFANALGTLYWTVDITNNVIDFYYKPPTTGTGIGISMSSGYSHSDTPNLSFASDGTNVLPYNTGSTSAPSTPSGGSAGSLAYTDYKMVIDDSSAQKITGVKTYSASPIVPTTPSGPSAAVAKSYVDLKVALAGNETITGIKTFATGATPLITDAPTTDLMAVNKEHLDNTISSLQTTINGLLSRISALEGSGGKVFFTKSTSVISITATQDGSAVTTGFTGVNTKVVVMTLTEPANGAIYGYYFSGWTKDGVNIVSGSDGFVINTVNHVQTLTFTYGTGKDGTYQGNVTRYTLPPTE